MQPPELEPEDEAEEFVSQPPGRRSRLGRVLFLVVVLAVIAATGVGAYYVLQQAGIGATPTPSPTFVDPGVAALQAHIPAAIADSCDTVPGEAPVTAVATCTGDNGAVDISYTLYETQGDMQAAYDGLVGQAGVTPLTGNCASPDAWPGEGTYFPASGEVRGRLMCVALDSVPTIDWTDEQLFILGQMHSANADPGHLFELWATDARPD